MAPGTTPVSRRHRALFTAGEVPGAFIGSCRKIMEKGGPHQVKRMMAILGCLFPIIGAVCIFFPEHVTKGLPYLLGGAMAVDGAAHIAIYIQSKPLSDDRSDQLARGLVLLIMGCAFMLQGARSLGAVGITWSIIGIRKASKSLSEMIRRIRHKEHFLSSLLLFLARITLALLLLFDPFEKVSAHIMILGMELIAVSIRFTIHGPVGADDEMDRI